MHISIEDNHDIIPEQSPILNNSYLAALIADNNRIKAKWKYNYGIFYRMVES